MMYTPVIHSNKNQYSNPIQIYQETKAIKKPVAFKPKSLMDKYSPMFPNSSHLGSNLGRILSDKLKSKLINV